MCAGPNMMLTHFKFITYAIKMFLRILVFIHTKTSTNIISNQKQRTDINWPINGDDYILMAIWRRKHVHMPPILLDSNTVTDIVSESVFVD